MSNLEVHGMGIVKQFSVKFMNKEFFDKFEQASKKRKMEPAEMIKILIEKVVEKEGGDNSSGDTVDVEEAEAQSEEVENQIEEEVNLEDFEEGLKSLENIDAGLSL